MTYINCYVNETVIKMIFSREIFFIACDHGIDMSSFSFEESDLSFKILYLFG